MAGAASGSFAEVHTVEHTSAEHTSAEHTSVESESQSESSVGSVGSGSQFHTSVTPGVSPGVTPPHSHTTAFVSLGEKRKQRQRKEEAVAARMEKVTYY
jgi:hypothetical protein